MTDGRAWISALDPRLERQRRALDELLDFCETRPEVTSLTVGCSLGRGAADELSDVDAAVGVAAGDADPGAQVRDIEEALVELLGTEGVVDVLREEPPSPETVVRRVFVQRADGVQLDLAVVPEPEVRRGDAAPDFVPLYRAEGVSGAPAAPARSAYAVSSGQVRTWSFLGWRALLDADKYLRRGSGWEAHQRLEEARHRVWQLWATAIGASYPWHGLSQVLDQDSTSWPPGIESTIAGLDHGDLRSAVARCADVLDDAGAAAAGRVSATLPGDFATYARHVLTADVRA